MLFHPTKYPDGDWSPNELQFEDVWFSASDGKEIHGWYCPCEDPRAYVLYFHGNAGNLTHRIETLVRLQSQLNVTVLIFDYRGYGRSEGRPTISGILRDARAASRFFAEKVGVAESDLLFMGRSLGGAVAIRLAEKVQPKGLVVQNSFASLKLVAQSHVPMVSWLIPWWILNSKSTIKKFAGHLLLSHGTDDFTVPFDHGVKIFDSANEPRSFVRIQGGGHNDPMPNSYYKDLSSFIAELNQEPD